VETCLFEFQAYQARSKAMTRLVFLTFAAIILLGSVASAQSTQSASVSVTRSDGTVDVDKIIRTMAAKEAEFRTALNQYGFQRDAVIQTVALGGQISGEYHRNSRFVFDDSGNRIEKIMFFPLPTLNGITVTPEDLDDLGGVQAFALESSKIHDYNFTYVGKEKIDELDLYVFDVTPKVLSDPKRLKEVKNSKPQQRFFQGRIWIDDRDFQIVKARGKGVPEFDQRFPTFETYREQIDGRFWFPTYAFADDELVFKGGQSVRIRMRVKFTDFARYTGKVRVIEEGKPGEVDPREDKPTPAPSPTPTPVKPKP
jgi:outer membrane lipoprotein-sorting protein